MSLILHSHNVIGICRNTFESNGPTNGPTDESTTCTNSNGSNTNTYPIMIILAVLAAHLLCLIYNAIS